jgi:hypothetical protein
VLRNNHVITGIFSRGIWTFPSELPASLAHLIPLLQKSVANSKAKNTINAYSSSFSQWQQFASTHYLSALPANPAHVALFLQSKALENKSPSCLINLLYGITWAHKCAVLPFSSNHALIQAVIESQKRSIEVNKNPKDELSQSAIHRLLTESAKSHPQSAYYL